MSIIIFPSKISGTIAVPPSKSYSQRACAAALLKGGRSILTNFGSSNDELTALEIIKDLGAVVSKKNNELIIESSFHHHKKFSNKIFAGESGLSLRLFTTIAGLLNYEIEITGEGSLLKRPITFFEETLPKLNVNVFATNHQLPVKACGHLQLNNIEIDGSISSQFLSGLLMAYSYLMLKGDTNEEVIIKVNNLKSKPYIDVTLDVLKAFSLPVPVHDNYEEFIFSKSNPQKNIDDIKYNIEGDWSSAAMLLVAGAIGGEIKLTNLNFDSKQADMKITEALNKTGCSVETYKNNITVTKPESLNCFDFDATDCPDLFPPLVALAANCNGTSIIKGVERLIYKESNRALALQQEFAKLGVEILIEKDIMEITGTKDIQPAIVNAHNDHRIAMALALAAINVKGFITIHGSEAINKSYPGFYNDMEKVGLRVDI